MHKFEESDGSSGVAYTVMGWINCVNSGGSWANVWHLSQKNANTPRNPSLYLNMGGRYLHTC